MKKKNFFEKKEYLDLKYSSARAPHSNYPDKLAFYIKDNFFKNQGRLLDIGCGTGDMMRAFSKYGFEVSGTDIAEVNEVSNKFNFVIGNLEEEKLNFDSNTFDFIFSKSVIEHLRNPINLLNESYRLLNARGKCVIMTPSWKHNSWGPFYFDFTHVSPFTKPSLRDAMLMAGFKNVKIFHFYQLPIIWKLPFLSVISKIISKLPIPYRPFYDIGFPNELNKFIRFSNEVMLFAYGEKN